nr:MAG TPA: hypothetical protein [Caudoviricetes sp.]
MRSARMPPSLLCYVVKTYISADLVELGRPIFYKIYSLYLGNLVWLLPQQG